MTSIRLASLGLILTLVVSGGSVLVLSQVKGGGDETGEYEVDRSNSRIQVFDENGKFLDVWPNVRRPYAFLMSADQHLWVSDGVTQKMLKFDLNGRLLYSWGTFGSFPGGFWGVHQFSVDQEGNLYTADVHIGRPQKFRPKPGADASKLIGAPMRAAG